jgi:hypothetical protein
VILDSSPILELQLGEIWTVLTPSIYRGGKSKQVDQDGVYTHMFIEINFIFRNLVMYVCVPE